MQEKKHPLLAFLMPPAVRGATLRVAGFGVAACGGGLGCCWHRLLPPAAAGNFRLRAKRGGMSLSCSCKKVTKEHAKGGDAHTPQPPLESPFGCLCNS